MKNLKYVLAQYVNGKHKKIISKPETFKEGLKQYEEILNEPVFFPKKYLSFNKPYESDLVLYGFKGESLNKYTNPRGFTKPIINNNQILRIKRINEYPVEETFIWYNKEGRKKINIYDLFKIIEIKNSLVTIKTTLTTNKISFEYFENNDIDLFVLKNNLDSFRLYELIKKYCNEMTFNNILFLYEPTPKEKNKLYSRIVERLQINREYLIRPYTH